MRKLVAVGLLLAVAPAASALVIIQDDFESYADTAALNLVWPVGAGTDVHTYLDTTLNGPSAPGTQSVHNNRNLDAIPPATTVAVRRDRNITPTVVPTGQYLSWCYDYYDFRGSTTDGRQYGQLLSRDSLGALNELLAMGQYNTVTKPGFVYDITKYQARVAFGPGQGWFNLAAARSVGWHTFEARIYPTTVDFYVDGNPDTLGLPHVGYEWYQARIGSGISSTADANYDNYCLDLVPEPGALFLLALGGLAVLRRR